MFKLNVPPVFLDKYQKGNTSLEKNTTMLCELYLTLNIYVL